MISVEECIQGDDYQKVVSFALENSDAVMLIFRNYGRPFKKRIKEVRNALKPFLIASRNNHKATEEGFAWPNTVSWDHALIHAYTYRLSPEVREYVLSADDIFSWMYPDRPEDIAFFSKGKCWFATTAHEKLCYIFDHETEIAQLLDTLDIEYMQFSRSDDLFTEEYPY